MNTERKQEVAFHHLTAEESFLKLHSSPHGLSSEESKRRLTQYGANKIAEKKEKPWWVLLLAQFADFMILVLLVAAVVSGFIGEIADTIIILILVLINAVLGFSQEYRARNAIKALKKMSALHATVLRDNEINVISSEELVPGDIILLGAGNIVAADVRLFETALLTIQESSLTGEAGEIEKTTNIIDEDATLGDRLNMAYKGTFITKGCGKGVVTATGMQTEFGKIAQLLQGEEVKTPLQKRMEQFSHKLSIIILIVCAIIFFVGLLRGEQLMLMLLTAISLAVAAIPEALPSVITIALSFGAKRMAKQNALIKKLPAVETLGSVTYICTDKTGTLTQDKMQVRQIYCDGKIIAADNIEKKFPCNENEFIFFISALNNTIAEKSDGDIAGDATELALYRFAEEHHYQKQKLLQQFPLVHIFPFDAQRKCMTTVHKFNDHFISFTKGAADVILDKTLFSNEEECEKAKAALEIMASEGLRIIAMAYRKWSQLPAPISEKSFEQDMNFVAFAGIADPPRHESREAVEICKTAGIQPIMITGDHVLTAKSIAIQIGIIKSEDDLLITSRQLNTLDDETLAEKAEHIKVIARVTPEQKLRIIKMLQQKNEFVAMTGDGVNDAPALHAADIGIAMGITGTDVAKEAADMILLDDNFSTIVKAVREGRRIYDNIRKFIRYVMTGNAGEVWTIFLAPFFGLPVPLLPIHILWINLVTDGLPGLALATEHTEKGIMQRPPRPTNESIFSNGMGLQIVWAGFLMGVVCIVTQTIAINNHLHWQTMVFTVLCFSQLGNAVAVRSEKQSVFSMSPLSNKMMFFAVTLTVIFQLFIIYLPFLNVIFRTQPLTLNELALALLLSMVIFVAIEIEKLIRRRIK